MGIMELGKVGRLGKPAIDPRRLDVMRRVADGIPALGVPLWHFNSLTRCDEILAWLLRNRITGAELQMFMRIYCHNSILGTAKEILRRIDANETAQPILVGRDFNPTLL